MGEEKPLPMQALQQLPGHVQQQRAVISRACCLLTIAIVLLGLIFLQL